MFYILCLTGLAGLGKAQSPLPLQHGVTYYSTVRAITNGDNVLETVSNGFTVDVTPPNINITDFGQYGTTVDLVSGNVKEIEEKKHKICVMFPNVIG